MGKGSHLSTGRGRIESVNSGTLPVSLVSVGRDFEATVHSPWREVAEWVRISWRALVFRVPPVYPSSRQAFVSADVAQERAQGCPSTKSCAATDRRRVDRL
jgi:hypothetical protein